MAVKNQHPGGQIGEDRFEIATRRFKFRPVALGFAPGIIKLAGHPVEGLGQNTQFVAAVDGLARGKVALRHGLRAFGQNIERRGQPTSHHIGQREGAEEGNEHGQRQRQGINAGQAFAGQMQFLIIAINALHGIGVMSQSRRHGLGHLQDAWLLEHTAGADRYQHAQVKFAAIAFDGAHHLRAARLFELGLAG